MAVMSAFMAWEWVRICGRGSWTRSGVATILIAPAILAVGMIWGLTIALGALAVAIIGTFIAARIEGAPEAGWLALGAGYVGLPCLALAWIRASPERGMETLLWVLVLVWATDTGAYVAGKKIGGPKLAPKISPNKTWAGLAGGAAAAALIGLATAMVLRSASPLLIALLSGALAVVEQGGDLFESGFKRHFGVKDSSNLIPGHGGVLDRVDGLLAVGLVVAGLNWALGRSILMWPLDLAAGN